MSEVKKQSRRAAQPTVEKGQSIQVPSNYDPVARTYSGAWDGTFKVAYSNNPAWCFYDLLTSPRFGPGKFMPAEQVDKWVLYGIGQYCDEMVPDGSGGHAPRFTLDACILNYAGAYQVLKDLESLFLTTPFRLNVSITTRPDAAADAVALSDGIGQRTVPKIRRI